MIIRWTTILIFDLFSFDDNYCCLLLVLCQEGLLPMRYGALTLLGPHQHSRTGQSSPSFITLIHQSPPHHTKNASNQEGSPAIVQPYIITATLPDPHAHATSIHKLENQVVISEHDDDGGRRRK